MRGRDAGNTPNTLTWRMRDEQELEAATPLPTGPRASQGWEPCCWRPWKASVWRRVTPSEATITGKCSRCPSRCEAGWERGVSAWAALSCRPLSSSASRRRLNQRPGGKGAKRSSPRRAAFEVSAGRGGWLRGLGEGTENNQRSPPSWSLGICSRPFVGAETCVSNVGEAPSPRTPASSQGGVDSV